MNLKDIKIIEEPELLINARNPQGELGDRLIEKMNVNHEKLAKWSLKHLKISGTDIILDIGCGGGVNVDRFCHITDNKVYGLDYSKVACEKSTLLNESAICEGRCEIIQGSVSEMPFDDNSFNIVTAFETVYFWPDFTNDLKEVRRVLKDNGKIFIANEALPKENDERQKELIELLDMNIYSENQLEEHLQEAGFSNIKIYIKESKDSFTGEDASWICAVAQK
ncbi:SAM-dependent methyltransferase [Methanobrevibacter sp. YE315]|uniref:class I SAM-dependent methyltransferase n=1 Tax=Methanobrevibacter sp. YE315 TaxID=1609968 RepID=UPI000764EEBE|nr:class I SAM-dependent methyltransferase [Methanobrevibacter sp. YE315]AMD17429.1 SAM-dependent methyltransferase [Methanobrevibacter sp. YE315]